MKMNGLAAEIMPCALDHFKGKHTLRSFEDFDRMPRGLRECVHEFGLPIVRACLQMKISEPRHIRQLVHDIWEGARQTTQRKESVARGSLDWLLIQAGAGLSAATLLEFLARHNLAIVSTEPTAAMVYASMDAVNHMGVVSKSAKHRNRLRAAIKAGALGANT